MSTVATALAKERQTLTKSELLNLSDDFIMKSIRSELKEKLPDCKFSVRKHVYSGGWSIHVSLVQAPYEVVKDTEDFSGYAQLNSYTLRRSDIEREREEGMCNGTRLTDYGWETLKEADRIANQYNWDESDPSTDYFNVNYYLHIEIGQWDKPFSIRG